MLSESNLRTVFASDVLISYSVSVFFALVSEEASWEVYKGESLRRDSAELQRLYKCLSELPEQIGSLNAVEFQGRRDIQGISPSDNCECEVDRMNDGTAARRDGDVVGTRRSVIIGADD